MKVGDLVKIHDDTVRVSASRRHGLIGTIISNLEPGRKRRSIQVFDVLWNNNKVENLCSGDLEVISESR